MALPVSQKRVRLVYHDDEGRMRVASKFLSASPQSMFRQIDGIACPSFLPINVCFMLSIIKIFLAVG